MPDVLDAGTVRSELDLPPSVAVPVVPVVPVVPAVPAVPANPRQMERFGTAAVPPSLPLTVVADIAVVTALAVFLVTEGGLALTGPVKLAAALVAGPLLAAGLGAAGVYRSAVQGHAAEELRRFVLAAMALLAVASTSALVLDVRQVRALVLVGLPAALAASSVVHLAAQMAARALHRRGRYRQRAVAVGSQRSVRELVRASRRAPESGIEVVAACVTGACPDRLEGVPVLGRPADVLTVLQVARADAVVLTSGADVSQEELRRLSWDLEGTGVRLSVVTQLAEIAPRRLRIRTIGGLPLVEVAEPEFHGVNRWVKTGLDYTLAMLGLVVLAPVLLAVALAVRASSPGPVLFRQERVGRQGKPFVMHKFRSMHADAEERLAQLAHLNEGDGPLFKLRDDPRVTRVGRFIRRFSLDELPQLFDVLAGRMSLVGPRPPLPVEVAQYTDDVRRRLLVKPGMTGLWQVCGRSDLSWEESVRLDLSYVENWFLGLDLSILARTVGVVLARTGAY